MSNLKLIIPERQRSIGNFLVGRLLPFQQKKMVGPFVFIDHMGPAQMNDKEGIDIPPHPHIGLSTLTFLFEGSIMHRDSLGVAQEIKPGQVNWMTAGKGVVHSERTPDHLRNTNTILHGLQIWVALPKDKEEIEGSFYHAEENDLPHWEEEGVSFKLIAGKLGDRQSPVPVYSPLYFIEIKATQDQTIELGKDLYGEAGLYILEGEIETENNSFGAQQMLIANDNKLCTFTIKAHAKVYIFGGHPFEEERFIYWNFVATSLEKIEEAKVRWRNMLFDKVPGETDFVPLPPEPSNMRLK